MIPSATGAHRCLRPVSTNLDDDLLDEEQVDNNVQNPARTSTNNNQTGYDGYSENTRGAPLSNFGRDF